MSEFESIFQLKKVNVLLVLKRHTNILEFGFREIARKQTEAVLMIIIQCALQKTKKYSIVISACKSSKVSQEINLKIIYFLLRNQNTKNIYLKALELKLTKQYCINVTQLSRTKQTNYLI